MPPSSVPTMASVNSREGLNGDTTMYHPLGPLTGTEFRDCAAVLQAAWPEHTSLQFKSMLLLEPPKTELLAYLDAERQGKSPQALDRRVYVAYYLRNTDTLHEAHVNLTSKAVERNERLGSHIHAPNDPEEVFAIEDEVLKHPRVQEELAKLKLPPSTAIVCDPWIYGSDGINKGDRRDDLRLVQCYLYARDPKHPDMEDGCHYAYPLPISPVMSPVDLSLLRIDILPTGLDHTVRPLQPLTLGPPSEYVPEKQTLREGLKPLHVVQPEGTSFTVKHYSDLGRTIYWQKWDFKIGFNAREGMIIYDVHYDDKPLFHRLSLSDMAIPYADPRHPYHRKAAFDLGDVGAGIVSNNLKLGCDCLGSIYYISGLVNDTKGNPKEVPNAICIHEVDDGILWKHTNYRTKRGVVVRNRELVVQQILTVANYEYVLAWKFNLSGDITYEVRATGILSTQPLDDSLTTVENPFGTVVHPGVLAAYHQHFFSLRIDPRIAGSGNEIACDEARALPRDLDLNPHGTGYTVKRSQLAKSGGYDLDQTTNRVFKILNSQVRNEVNGSAVGYKIHAPPMQFLLADQDSYHHKRAEFADHNIYLTKYREDELFAGGTFTNQSRGGTGVRSWADRNEHLDGEPVVWVNFGLNHFPRVENFPVMPAETIKIMLRPDNFFGKNPAIDVPPSEQAFNKSVLVNGCGRT
ncbi:Copper amine oxidase 1 [Pseudocercospora fuligena]|uniref:Amine oxidase n=1 Tax=Pseudocercospora fuligena TaxID=685502 RepID=A0A8H6RIE4_9PEZI|nr:Copper amine oxidase 1 [Pseudocercospora fuligena]